jgi:hypothetical protein
MLAGKGLALQGKHEEAGYWYRTAFGMAKLFEQGVSQRWPFWVAPQNLASRLRLEFLSWAYPGHVDPRQLEWWLDLPAEIRGLDDDRLASAVLAVKTSLKPFPLTDTQPGLIEQSRGVSLADDVQAPIHQGYDPFFCIAALEMAYAGQVTAALDLLAGQSAENESAASSFLDTLAADRTHALIGCRFRLDRPVPDSLSRSTDVGDRTLAWTMRSLGKDFRRFDLDSGDESGLKNARWITSVAPDLESAKLVLAWAKRSLEPGELDLQSFVGASRALDLIEANAVAERFELPAVGKAPDITAFESADASLESVYIVNLRLWALGIRKEFPSSLVDRLGRRMAAMTAFTLGELLALRLPKPGLMMLEFAANNFDPAADPVLKTTAATCCALTSIRLRANESLARWVKVIEDQFQAGKSEFLSPEKWERIDNVSKQRPMGKGELLDWTWPWIVRIALCVVTNRGYAAEIFGLPTVPPEFSGAETVLPLGLPEPIVVPPRVQFKTRAIPPPPAVPDKVLRIKCTPKPGAPILDFNKVTLLPSTGDMIEVTTPRPTIPYRESDLSAVRAFNDAEILEMDRSVAWVNWESILDPDGKHWYRRRIEGIAPAGGVLWNDAQFLTLTADHYGADLGGSAFGKTEGWSYVYELEELKSRARSGVQILHIASDALETSSGVRLSLRSLERSKDDRGQLVRPADLMQMVPNLRMCILQPPIVREPQRRTEIDREKACYLRAFAAELRAAGCGIVVTLPSLTFELQVPLLGAIVEGKMSLVPGAAVVAPFFTALAERRSQLMVSLPPDSVEAAFDICYLG